MLDGEALGDEDAVEALEGEGTLAVDEIRYVGLLEAGLTGKLSAGEGAVFDAALCGRCLAAASRRIRPGAGRLTHEVL